MSVQKFSDFIGNPGFDWQKIATMNLFSFVQILVKNVIMNVIYTQNTSR